MTNIRAREIDERLWQRLLDEAEKKKVGGADGAPAAPSPTRSVRKKSRRS